MGWAGSLDLVNLKAVLPVTGLYWLIAGGLVYTLGVVFYILDHTKYFTHSHGIWHFFVLVGSICHFIFVIGYVR
jgi:hemolysin III